MWLTQLMNTSCVRVHNLLFGYANSCSEAKFSRDAEDSSTGLLRPSALQLCNVSAKNGGMVGKVSQFAPKNGYTGVSLNDRRKE